MCRCRFGGKADGSVSALGKVGPGPEIAVEKSSALCNGARQVSDAPHWLWSHRWTWQRRSASARTAPSALAYPCLSSLPRSVLLIGCLIPGLKQSMLCLYVANLGMNLLVGLSASQPHRCTVLNHACAQQFCIDNLQEEAKKKSRAERFNLPKSKAELDKEAKAKAAALAAELAEKKRQRGERFGTLSEVRRSPVLLCPPSAVPTCCVFRGMRVTFASTLGKARRTATSLRTTHLPAVIYRRTRLHRGQNGLPLLVLEERLQRRPPAMAPPQQQTIFRQSSRW